MATTRRRGGRFSGGGGYTLIEMTVAMAIAVIIGAGLYAVMNSQRRSSGSQKLAVDLQTSCNFAMDQIKQDLLLAGYRGEETDDPAHTAATKNFSLATGSEVAFEFYDDKAKFNSVDPADSRYDASIPYNAQYTEHTSVHYLRESATNRLLRNIKRWNTATTQYQTEISQPLATGVMDLQFQYFNSSGNATTTLDDIRNVKVLLSCAATKQDPFSGRTPRLTLTAEVQPRNIGLKSSPKDTTPPGPPQLVRAWNPAVCGTPSLCPNPTLGCAKLELRWTANAEADLAGYKIIYGFDASNYSNSVQIFRGPKTSGDETYTLTGLAVTKFSTWPGSHSVYKIQVQAFDKNKNFSALSTPVILGDKVDADSIRAAADLDADPTNNDTTSDVEPAAAPDPASFKAEPPAGWDADPPTAESMAKWNKMVLTWTASATPGVIGYRIYRGESASFEPSDTAGPTYNRIADETVVGANAVTYTDTVPKSCDTYHYKIAAINCDPTFPLTGTKSLLFSATSGVARDLQAPTAPKIEAASGFRRIILALTNPMTSGMGAVPDFDHSEIYWNKQPGSFPAFNPSTDLVEPHTLIPKSSPGKPAGTWVGDGSLPSINFNHHTDPGAGNDVFALDPDTTYYFLAVSYDTCGNHSTTTSSSVAEGTQCGDCLIAEPEGTPAGVHTSASHDPDCWGAPLEMDITGLKVEGCYDFIKLGWNQVDSTFVRDFQGYRVYRREGESWSDNPASEVLLTGTDASPANYFEDKTDIENGKSYSYRVMATDCYWEQHHDTDAADWPEDDNDPNDNFRDIFRHGLSIGAISRNTTKTVVTGDLAETDPTLEHNSVTAWMNNAATQPLALKEITASWENAAAYLKRLDVGPGDSTLAQLGFDDHSSVSGSVNGLDTPATIAGSDTAVPFKLTYTNQDGSVNQNTNMREDTLALDLKWLNTSTDNSVCTAAIPSFRVPLGPLVSSVRMSEPSIGTFASAVPGDSGTTPPGSIVVSGSKMPHVFADVVDTAIPLVGIKHVWLFYYPTADLAQSAQAAQGTFDPSAATGGFTNYTGIPMDWQGGDQYRTRTPIPISENANVWFFVLAVDYNDNFNRAPRPGSGAFQYYQQQANACDNTPNPPTISGTDTAGSPGKVTLSLSPDPNNTNGLPLNDFNGFNVYRSTNGVDYAYWKNVPLGTTFTEDTSGDLGTKNYSYKATALDLCKPTPNESEKSGAYSECLGAPACTVSITPSGSPFYAGGTLSVGLNVCSKAGDATDYDHLWIQDCSSLDKADPIKLVEKGNTGVFEIDKSYYSGNNLVQTYLTGDYPSPATNLDLQVAPTDVITVGGYSVSDPPSTWDSTCQSSTLQCTSTLEVVPDPCLTAPSMPGTPTISSIVKSPDVGCSQTSAGNPPVAQTLSLTWGAVAGATSYNVFRCSVNNSGSSSGATCTPGGSPIANTTSTTYTDYPTGRLDQNFYGYSVSAVADPCPANFTPLEGSKSATASDPCN